MAISPIASPTFPQAGQAGGGDPVRSPVPRRGPVRCARDEETGMYWTDERIENLRTMWEKELTDSQIAEELCGVSRNAVIAKEHHLGLNTRPWPVQAAVSG